MPHQCVRCGFFYEDGSAHILDGCKCGGKLFFFVAHAKLEKAREAAAELSSIDKENIEIEVLKLTGSTEEDTDPVVLDFESIKSVAPGKFELDLVNLFNKDKPLIYKLSEGKYVIDLPKTFKKSINR